MWFKPRTLINITKIKASTVHKVANGRGQPKYKESHADLLNLKRIMGIIDGETWTLRAAFLLV